MKRSIVLALSLLIVLIFASCVDFRPLKQEGVYESDAPEINVIISKAAPAWNEGELIKNDGTVTKIQLRAARGRFTIYEMFENGELGDCIYIGDYKEKKDTLILIPEEGDEIVLKKVSEVPDQTVDTSIS
ncbi:MAG: hypothetical protein IJ027_05950 [Oscillospiraceae bacterium]|nr:hypothetical protein [Oscillospiraceae bacterium]